MSHFSKKVDTRSRQGMVEFLKRHFRYDTMKGWNRCTSYSNKIKVHSLGLTSTQADKAYQFLSADQSFWDELNPIIDDFTEEQNGQYTIGTNGRNAGYLVLYNSRYESTGYKSVCRTCGQRNYKTIAECGNNTCGRCRATGVSGRIDYHKLPTTLSTYPGRSIDHQESFDVEEWSMSALKARVQLVQKFDAVCDDLRDSFIDMLGEFDVVEETVMVPTKRRSLINANSPSMNI